MIRKPSATQMRTRANQVRFIAELAETGSIGASAAACGLSIATVESWDSLDTQGFKEKKRSALALFLGKVEAEINRRAIDGAERPLSYKGRLTGDVIKEYSDNLLMFRAKKLNPEYRDNHQSPNSQPLGLMQININLHPDAIPNQPRISGPDADTVIDQ